MVGQVGQLGQLYGSAQPAAPPMGILPPGMQGMLGGRGSMVGALPYGGIGQIPEHAEGQVGHNGQFVPTAAPRIAGPINRLIGPLPTSHELPAPNPMQYGIGGMPAGMHGMVGRYPSVGQVPTYSTVGGYQMHGQHQHQHQYQAAAGYPTGSIGQMDARRSSYPNAYGMHQRAADARQMFQHQSGGPPVSHIGTTSQHMSEGASGRNVGEISQQSLANSLRAQKAAGADSKHELPRSHEMSQVLHYLQGWQGSQHRPPDQSYNTYQQQVPLDLATNYSGGRAPQQSSVSHLSVSLLSSSVHAALPLDLQVPCIITPWGPHKQAYPEAAQCDQAWG